jgi:hypothetical protein
MNIIKNIIPVLIDQGPFSRFLRNLRKGHLIGIVSKRSHLTSKGAPKVRYNTKASAEKAAASMKKKYGHWYSNYRCLYCGGFHVGKNSENKNPLNT